MLGSASNLYAVEEEPDAPRLATVFAATASRRGYTLGCNVVLFAAFAAEAYVNELLAEHLTGADLDAIDSGGLSSDSASDAAPKRDVPEFEWQVRLRESREGGD